MTNSSLKPYIALVDPKLAYLDAAKKFLDREMIGYPILVDPGPIDALHTALYTILGRTIFLVGHDLGDMTGLAFIDLLKKRFRFPAFFILLTPRGDDVLAGQALKKEALFFHQDTLPGGPVHNLGGLFKDLIGYAEQKLNEESMDELTGAYNRRQALLIWKKDFISACKERTSTSFLFIDVNFLKETNGRYQDITGDNLLRAVAQVLKESLGTSLGYVCRQGGDEFLIILPKTDFAGAQKVARYIREAVSKIRLDIGNNLVIGASVSIGMAVLSADHLGSSAHEALRAMSIRSARNMRRNKDKMHAQFGNRLPPPMKKP